MATSKAKAEIGRKAPNFSLEASSGEQVKLSDYIGKKVIVYFYPKDATTACTQEACDFRDAYEALAGHGAVVLGISPDPIKSHQRFIEKQELPFLLLSDPEHKVCELYGVWQLKKLYGREYMGIVRSTFLIDEKGKLIAEWRNLKVKGHVQKVLETLQG
ncbi:thioredoxin-dependent thiol peroxidase [Paenibacillus radicis (ex Gao et al. 2016)]|uniref:thioredoxin-dependent peroxiredoxin n=1 Tax=Paenibacillus radicis (ex Gao et al. 2016) TaxID=1737354 RepID=A0A917HFP4_9BACL|nr:thioredoxin-dependent thiol peroxidase [Paenibacillus radicis (ex Gao et al. 2016)]GGG78170.1 peroxiredoxin [Paenibacillus radicis (ex Gao et al. 2016)]